MSNELTRLAASTIAKSDDSLSRSTGKTLVTVGVGSGALWLVAGMLPLITFPMLMVLAVLAGIWFYAK